jgi:nicotinate phosphoribosyltransferase
MLLLTDNIENPCLLSDFYQITMAAAYFEKQRFNDEAAFQLFFRRLPFKGGFALAGGISDAINYITNFHFDKDSLLYLASLKSNSGSKLFKDDFLAFLADIKANVRVEGIKDGNLIFPNEPIIRIEGPLGICQLLETALLNIINFQTLISTKAARIKLAAQNRMVVDFGLRRAQGFNGAISASKAAYIGGIDATSNMWLAKNFLIPLNGTMAHSFIMSYSKEFDAFKDYAELFPDNCVLLVDTYDSLLGVKKAVEVFLDLKKKGHSPIGIRLDSGDLLSLSKSARLILDNAGLKECIIIASGDLDEYIINRLIENGAPIDAFGVGTRLITAFDEPALGGVYKLFAIKEEDSWRDTFKISNSKEKEIWPGRQAIRRSIKNGIYNGDLVYALTEDNNKIKKPEREHESFELHTLLYDQQKNFYHDNSLAEARARAELELSRLPKELTRLHPTKTSYTVSFDDALCKKRALMEQAR